MMRYADSRLDKMIHAVLACIGAAAITAALSFAFADASVARRCTRIERAVEAHQFEMAQYDLLILAKSPRLEGQAQRLSRIFWLALNNADVPVHTVTVLPDAQSDKVLLQGLREALRMVVRANGGLATTHTLLTSVNAMFASKKSKQRAFVAITEVALVVDLDRANALLPEIATLPAAIQKEAPLKVLGAALFFTGQYDKLVELRRLRVPILQPPLTKDQRALLQWEVQATFFALGIAEATRVAQEYFELGSFDHPLEMRAIEVFLRTAPEMYKRDDSDTASLSDSN